MAPPVALSGVAGMAGHIAHDVPYAFRDGLDPVARLELKVSDALKEMAGQPSVALMKQHVGKDKGLMSLSDKALKMGHPGERVSRRIVLALRRLDGNPDPSIVRAGLVAQAFEIDSNHAFAVRNACRMGFRPRELGQTLENEVSTQLRQSGVSVGSGKVSVALTDADIADAKALLNAPAGRVASRPSGLATSRTAFFLAANVTALSGVDQKSGEMVSGREVLEAMTPGPRKAEFSLSGLGRSAARAANLEGWMSNLAGVVAETRNRSQVQLRQRPAEHTR